MTSVVDSLSVRSERNSPTDYIATLDFRFQPDAVRTLLERENIPYADRQAPVVTVVPIWRMPADTASLPGQFQAAKAPSAWTEAWKGLDLQHTLTPVKLEPLKAEIPGDVLKSLALADGALWSAFAGHYAAAGERLMAAIAEPDMAKKRLNVTLLGYDGAGAVSWRKAYRVDVADAGYAIELAAVVSLGVLEGRWKSTTVRGAVPALARGRGPIAQGDGIGSVIAPTARPPGDSAGQMQINVEFRGMAEWQDISRRLSAVPGVDTIDVLGMSGRNARVTFRFGGNAEQLSEAVGGQGLALRPGGGSYVLTLR